MRIDAKTDSRAGKWTCWDCERCCKIKTMRWADDQLNAWGEVVGVDRYELVIRVVLEREVVIYPDRLLILVNPVPEPTYVIDGIIAAVMEEA